MYHEIKVLTSNKLISKMLKQFIDIGANLSDSMFSGIYNGSVKHQNDLTNVLARSWDAGLQKLIITGGSVAESKLAFDLALADDRLHSTVGCHPTRCLEFEENGTNPDSYLEDLKTLIINGGKKVVAIGECGLDYDRVQFCPKEIQQKYFEKQLSLCKKFDLPLFLHCRSAATDLQRILMNFSGLKGVVHSFDGTVDEAELFLKMGFYIGLNGCSLKSPENLETVKTLPSDRILIETDSPWCEIRPTHSGYKHVQAEHKLPSVKKEKWTENCMIKGRNEPANIRQVLDVIASVRNEDANELCATIYQNSLRLFFPTECNN